MQCGMLGALGDILDLGGSDEMDLDGFDGLSVLNYCRERELDPP